MTVEADQFFAVPSSPYTERKDKINEMREFF